MIAKCPYFKKPCLEHGCTHYQQLRGNHPQTGQPVDEWMCADLWINILLIENTQKQNEMGGAIESFRNEMVRQNIQLINTNRLTDGQNQTRINGFIRSKDT